MSSDTQDCSPPVDLVRDVRGVAFAVLLPGGQECDALGAVRGNLAAIEARMAGRPWTIFDAGAWLEALYADMGELARRGILRSPPAFTATSTYYGAHLSLEAAGAWLTGNQVQGDALSQLPDREEPQPAGTASNEGGTPHCQAAIGDPLAELKRFAVSELKGQERAVIEALCDAGLALPIFDLAVKVGVNWENPNQNFKDAQRRLNPKLKSQGWRLQRSDNKAVLISLPS